LKQDPDLRRLNKFQYSQLPLEVLWLYRYGL
jgi:hypothetical protein